MSEKVTCDKCLGERFLILMDSSKQYIRCPKCLGEGELDWVERVVGKKLSKKWLCGYHVDGNVFWIEYDRPDPELLKTFRPPKHGRKF
jgi:hypothetical protein